MKTVTLITLSLFVGWAIILNSAWCQEDMTVVDNSGFDNPQRTPSVFVHDEHNEMAEIDDCATCHHVYEDGELVADESSEDQSCSECHDQEGSDDQPALIKAFHANCKGCHQEQEKGPILCGECHKK
jgi:predicted CXXCH cytochrome family protein